MRPARTSASKRDCGIGMNNILTHLATFIAGLVVGVFLGEWLLSALLKAEEDEENED